MEKKCMKTIGNICIRKALNNIQLSYVSEPVFVVVKTYYYI